MNARSYNFRKSTGAALTLAVIAFAGVSIATHLERANAAAPAGGVQVGSPAPKFTLPNVATGAATSLSALGQDKKATVIMFIATRCPVSNAYNDRMETLAKTYMKKQIEFVGINANTTEPTEEVAGHAKDHNFTFPVLKDADDKVADLYDAHVTPETFVVSSTGVIVYHGRIDNSMDPANVASNDLSTALDDILAGKTVAKPETKAFGCSIKRAH
jgi:peroxiredoxin